MVKSGKKQSDKNNQKRLPCQPGQSKTIVTHKFKNTDKKTLILEENFHTNTLALYKIPTTKTIHWNKKFLNGFEYLGRLERKESLQNHPKDFLLIDGPVPIKVPLKGSLNLWVLISEFFSTIIVDNKLKSPESQTQPQKTGVESQKKDCKKDWNDLIQQENKTSRNQTQVDIGTRNQASTSKSSLIKQRAEVPAISNLQPHSFPKPAQIDQNHLLKSGQMSKSSNSFVVSSEGTNKDQTPTPKLTVQDLLSQDTSPEIHDLFKEEAIANIVCQLNEFLEPRESEINTFQENNSTGLEFCHENRDPDKLASSFENTQLHKDEGTELQSKNQINLNRPSHNCLYNPNVMLNAENEVMPTGLRNTTIDDIFHSQGPQPPLEKDLVEIQQSTNTETQQVNKADQIQATFLQDTPQRQSTSESQKVSSSTKNQSRNVTIKSLDELETTLYKLYPDDEIIRMMKLNGDSIPIQVKEEIYYQFQKEKLCPSGKLERLIGFTTGCITMSNINRDNAFKHISDHMAQMVVVLMEHNKSCESMSNNMVENSIRSQHIINDTSDKLNKVALELQSLTGKLTEEKRLIQSLKTTKLNSATENKEGKHETKKEKKVKLQIPPNESKEEPTNRIEDSRNRNAQRLIQKTIDSANIKNQQNPNELTHTIPFIANENREDKKSHDDNQTASPISEPECQTSTSVVLRCEALTMIFTWTQNQDTSVDIRGPKSSLKQVNDCFKFSIKLLKLLPFPLMITIDSKDCAHIMNNIVAWKKAGTSNFDIITKVKKNWSKFDCTGYVTFQFWNC